MICLITCYVCQIIVISSIFHYRPLVYTGSVGTYVYPEYANVLGWFLACSSMGIIPAYVIYYLCTSKGTLKEVRQRRKSMFKARRLSSFL